MVVPLGEEEEEPLRERERDVYPSGQCEVLAWARRERERDTSKLCKEHVLLNAGQALD